MRRILAAAGLLAALLWVGHAGAVTMYACAGTQVDTAYRSTFDGVRGQALDGNVRYPDRRTFWEHQSWLTPVGQEPGHGSEHIHVAACLPQGETLTTGNGTEWIDIVVTAHNVSGYRATALTGNYNGATDSALAFSASQEQLDQITTAMQTSGHTGANRVYVSLPLLATAVNGIKEVRWGLTVERSDATALVERWRLQAHNYWTHAYPGLPDFTPQNDHVRYIRNRTIVDFVKPNGTMGSDYHHAGLCNKNLTADGLDGCDSDAWDWDDYIATRPASWDMGTRVTDGGSGATFEIDPNHHVHPDYRGKWFLDWEQRSTSNTDPDQYLTHTIPLGSLGLTGWHKLFFGSDDEPECVLNNVTCPVGVRPAWRDVVVMPFKAS